MGVILAATHSSGKHSEYFADIGITLLGLSFTGTSCGHIDEGIFDDELMTGYVDSVSKFPWVDTTQSLKSSITNPSQVLGSARICIGVAAQE